MKYHGDGIFSHLTYIYSLMTLKYPLNSCEKPAVSASFRKILINWLSLYCIHFIEKFLFELAIVRLQWVPLLRCWVHTSNPVRVVTTATNQKICHSKVGMSSSFHLSLLIFPFALRNHFTLHFKYFANILFNEINFSCDVY